MLHARWTGIGLTLAGLLASLGTASAQSLEILVNEIGGPTVPITDNGALDTDPTIGVINVNTALLNPLLINYSFSDLEAIRLTNALSQMGTATALVQGQQSVTITASDVGFTDPVGNPKTMITAAFNTFRNTAAGDSRTFQGFFDPTNTLGGTAIPSPLLAFIPPVGAGPFNSSNSGVASPLGMQPVPYSLTNTTVLSLHSGGGANQFTGSTTITSPASVPEPGSVALLVSLGLTGASLLARRRRK